MRTAAGYAFKLYTAAGQKIMRNVTEQKVMRTAAGQRIMRLAAGQKVMRTASGHAHCCRTEGHAHCGPRGALEGAWQSAGWRPASLGRWVAAQGALCYAPLESLGPAGWVAGRSARLGPDAVVTTIRARGTDGLCDLGY